VESKPSPAAANLKRTGEYWWLFLCDEWLINETVFYWSGGASSDSSRPAYGCQVVVQSQTEKQLKKQVRKEEKKINKILGQLDLDMEEEPDINVMELRMKRYEKILQVWITRLSAYQPNEVFRNCKLLPQIQSAMSDNFK